MRAMFWTRCFCFRLRSGRLSLLKSRLRARRHDRYILMYDLEQTDEIRRFATTFAKEKGLKIYAVNNYKRTVYADRDFYKSGPRTFIKLIKNAEMVIGNSLHAMAFSLIFKKEFLVFPRLHEGADINTRMISLLDETGLQDRLLKSFDLGSAAFPEINYDFVHATLKQRIAYSDIIPG